MIILKNKNELEQYIFEQKQRSKIIGFAPTMGALHDGHLSLYEMARPQNDVVISSIFVNPTQFNNAEDLEKYPRTIETDLEKLQQSQLVDAVYIPSIEDIYPEKTISQHYDFDGLENEMEGKMRPGHFDGVGTVVEELFRQIQPDNAYFGEKDFQQLAIIKKLVEKKQMDINIISVPIYREANGLAMSSRNMRLTPEERSKAKIIYETLQKAKKLFPNTDIPTIKQMVENTLSNIDNFDLEYFTIADELLLKETETIEIGKNYRAFIVVNVNNVRLIDNIGLGARYF